MEQENESSGFSVRTRKLQDLGVREQKERDLIKMNLSGCYLEKTLRAALPLVTLYGETLG